MRERAGLEPEGGEGQRQAETARAGSRLLEGAALLGAAAVLTKLLGTMQKIPLQNLAGDAAFGIYSAIYPLYMFILFAATAGFPVTVAKFVSEQAAAGDREGAARAVAVSSVMLTVSGVAAFWLVYRGAGTLASWIGIAQTEPAIRSVSFALLFAPLMAVLRGYFQGYHNVVPTAVSQVAEQLIRVASMIALLLFLLSRHASDERIAAGAAFGSVTGTAAGLLVMLVYWRKDRPNRLAAREAARNSVQAARLSYLQWAKRLLKYAIPISLGTLVVPLLTLVDTFTMPRLLELLYGAEAEAMRQFGLYNRGFPLVQLVVMVASSMSAVLVPAIAEAKWRGEAAFVRSRSEAAVRLAWLIGLASAFGLAFAAVPINVMLYSTAEGSAALAVLAFTALLSTLNAVTASVLQGAGDIRTPALSLLIAIALKALGNVMLVPRWGIEGAALSAVIAYAAAAGLNLVQTARCTGARFALRPYAAGPMLAVGLMGVCVAALQFAARPALAWLHVPERWAHSAIALLCVGAGAAVYAAALLRSGSISREELRLMPKLERKLTPLLRKFKLLPPEVKSGGQPY